MTKKYYETTCDFLKAIENRILEDKINEFYHSDVEQIEYPNLLTKELAKRDINIIRDGISKGQKVLSKETYELIKYYEVEDTVIIEAIWKGTLAIPLGKLEAGDEMKAYFAQVYEFKGGKIYRQRNYDCFESF